MQDVLMFLVLCWPTHPFWIWCFVRWYWSFKDPSSQTAASCSSTASNVRRRTSFYLCTHCSSCAWLRGRRYCLWELWTDAIDSNCFSNSLAFLPASSILNCRSSPGERRIHRTVLYTFSGFFSTWFCVEIWRCTVTLFRAQHWAIYSVIIEFSPDVGLMNMMLKRPEFLCDHLDCCSKLYWSMTPVKRDSQFHWFYTQCDSADDSVIFP